MALYDEVYGLSFESASEQMKLNVQAIDMQRNKGFNSLDDLKQWARDNHLDKVLFSNMKHSFLHVSHKGEIITAPMFAAYYGDILFYEQKRGDRLVRVEWTPSGFEYYDKAYIAAEQTDGVHRPLYYRDYTVPTGFFSIERDAFNIAKPFPVFAKETGRDTSHIYTYIEHIAGECAYHLLAWLRAKMLYPTIKTQVVPIIVSRAQGSGKTTFAEVICKGLFGKDNVLVTDQYDSQSRFNADYADALIVCQEEKEETDKRNPAGALKSRATATTIRKELKGIDPVYQESYTDFIMTTNKDVPIKFDGREDQRRFMIMEADEHFTRKESELADEVFTKLYGFDANYNPAGKGFVDDIELIQQFKHELFTRADIAAVELRKFPKTAAYRRCFTLPRTTEATEIEAILRALAPFIKASLEKQCVVDTVDDQSLTDVIMYKGAMQYMPAFKEHAAFIALCRPLVFYELSTQKAFQHSVVERGIYDCGPWLIAEYGIHIIPDMDPLLGGFTNVSGRYRTASAAKFCLVEDAKKNPVGKIERFQISFSNNTTRIGKRLRVNKNFLPDENGCFETVNEMKPGVVNLKDKTNNVQYMDNFLLESDEATSIQVAQEKKRADEWIVKHGIGSEVQASYLYKERLHTASYVSASIFNKGIAHRVVYSGAKSYHLLIRVGISPSTLEEYKWLHAYLCNNITDKLLFDESTADPARLTRSPLTLDRVTSNYNLLVYGEQKLVSSNTLNVYNIDWRPLYEQWKQRPLNKIEETFGKPLYPTRPEYLDATSAIIEGTFWNNPKYNGDRQRLFFPAYRLLRALGYSHSDAWTVINKGLANYVKQDEIGYWRSRETSNLIIRIDEELDGYNSKWEDDDA